MVKKRLKSAKNREKDVDEFGIFGGLSFVTFTNESCYKASWRQN
jgi:hypothetical protein